MTDVTPTSSDDALLIDRRTGRGRPNGWSRYVTVERFLLVVMLLIQGSTWKANNDSSLSSLERRVVALELAAANIPERIAGTYMRQDVISERLRSIEERLSGIEISIRRRQP